MKSLYDSMRRFPVLVAGVAACLSAAAQEGPGSGAFALPAIVERSIAHLGPYPDPPPGMVAAPEPTFDAKLARLAGALSEDAAYRLSSSLDFATNSADVGPSAVVDGDWTVVTNTKLIPYRAVCYIETTWNQADEFGEPIVTVGTGAFVSPRVILTSARNVRLAERGGFCGGVRVYPGRSGSKKPYGSDASWAAMTVTSAWASGDESADNDFAYIALADTTLYSRFGYVFEYRLATDAQLKRWNLNSLGYPTPLETGIKMRQDFETQNQLVTPARFRYFHDAKAGCEGGPVFYVRPADGARQIVGFYSQTPNSGTGNFASRLDETKAQLLAAAIAAYD